MRQSIGPSDRQRARPQGRAVVVASAIVLSSLATSAAADPGTAVPAPQPPAAETPSGPASPPAQPTTPAPTKAAPGPAPSVQASPPLPPKAAAAPPVTTNDVTLNLIHLLVQQKIITAKQADALFQQAQQQAGAAAAPVAAPVGPGAASPPTIGSAPPPVPPGAPPTVRVTYVPEAVKQEIKEETKKELIAEGSLPPPPASVLPEWLRGFKFDGDFRFRYERVLYDGSNSNLFINYNALAQSSTPFDISSNQLSFPPLLDTTEDRTLVRVRARFGFTDALSNDVTLGMRL